jgi:UDP-glucose 4-epimerase
MKLSSEALASASAESFLSQINLFRFPNVVGTPATHGVILDFIKKLSDNKLVLNVLGNGTQQKAYLHVSDLISAMLFVVNRKLRNKIELLNIGPIDKGVTVKWIAECVVSRVSPNAQILFGSGNRGWVGDVPKFSYSTDLIQSYGWKPSMNSEEAVLLSVDQISTQLGF